MTERIIGFLWRDSEQILSPEKQNNDASVKIHKYQPTAIAVHLIALSFGQHGRITIIRLFPGSVL